MKAKQQRIKKDAGLNSVRKLVQSCKATRNPELVKLAYQAEAVIARMLEERAGSLTPRIDSGHACTRTDRDR